MYAACIILIIAALGCVKDVTASDASLDGHWSTFLRVHEKSYLHEEESHRRDIWETNIGLINRHNLEYDLGLQTYRQEVNWYTDLSDDQIVGPWRVFEDWNLYDDSTPFKVPIGGILPPLGDFKDWRDAGCVTPVKDMKTCFASWAFSATGSLESQVCIKKKRLVRLSEQNLIDCSGPQGNKGCHGGSVLNAFSYIKQNGGIDTEASYPYTGVEGQCRYDPDNSGASISGHFAFSSTNDDSLRYAIRTIGPISVVIDARPTFFSYKGGIYYDPDCSSTNVYYSVLVVGYGTTEDGRDYWIVKNSQGTKYGENGYIRMYRGVNNVCGISSRASYPLLYDDGSISIPDSIVGDLPSLDLSDFPTHLKF